MKKISICLLIVALVSLPACNSFLNIVPDNVATMENAFSMRTNAEKSLFACYSYLPNYRYWNADPAQMGAGEMTVLQFLLSWLKSNAVYIARGYQNAASPYCDFWTGANGGKDLYEAIRSCNTLIENLDEVEDMDEMEKKRWVDEAKFLKAFYHFYLTRMYGPIPIVDKNKEIGSSIEDVHVYRNTLDECFDYIVALLDEVLQDGGLPDVIDAEATELGRVTNGIVKAFKAQVLIYAASPLFNGNTDYVGYTDNRGVEIFCPNKTEAEKAERWQAAASACKVAIDMLSEQGYKLFTYSDNSTNLSDQTNFMLSHRMSFNQAENMENIWYYTNGTYDQYGAYPFRFTGTSRLSDVSSGGGGILSVPIETALLYYTKNGLPIEEDVTYDVDGIFDPREATEDDKNVIEPGFMTVGLHFDRENRFYSDLAFDGASWFGNGVTQEASVYLHAKAGQANGFAYATNGNVTGYWARKYINTKTICNITSFIQSGYFYPILSLRQLYLYYAEALNESGAPYKDVLPWIDAIRQRSGVPDVVTSWERYSRAPDMYKSKEGLRSIIHREEIIEMMFEGQMIWDLRRWKEAISSLSHTVNGWNYSGNTYEAYYTQMPMYIQHFEVKDYFWPIRNSEIYANNNIVQNPGW